MRLVSFAAFAVAMMALVVVAQAGNTYCSGTCPQICRSCPAPAWDRTPVCYTVPSSQCAMCEGYAYGAGPATTIAVDPWESPCGAFCASGQVPPGWPYGWHDEYWLRPDSNF